MINEKNEVNQTMFVELFKKKFSNFCQKAPVLISYTVFPDSIQLKCFPGTKKEVIKTFSFLYNEDVKLNIKIIKDWLYEECYPVIIRREEKKAKLSDKEIEKISKEQNISIKDIILNTYEYKDTHYKITRLILKSQNIFLEVLSGEEKGIQYIIHLKGVPLYSLLKKINYDMLDPYEAFEYIFAKGKIVKTIYLENEQI